MPGRERSYNKPEPAGAGSLIPLVLACAFAAILLGFGSSVLSFSSGFEGSGRELLIQFGRVVLYLSLAVVLVFKGGWWGVLAATLMVVAATSAEWALLPLAYHWAAIEDPAGYAETFGEFVRPSYLGWVTLDVVGFGISAAFAQGLRMIASSDPRGWSGE